MHGRWHFWRDRLKDTFERARGKAELVAFLIFLGSQPLAREFPWLAIDKDTWLAVLGIFFLVFLGEICFASPYRLFRDNQLKILSLREEIQSLKDNRLQLAIKVAPGPVLDDFGGWLFGIFVSHNHPTRTATNVNASIRGMELIAADGNKESIAITLPLALVSYDEVDTKEIPPQSQKGYEMIRISGGLSRKAFEDRLPIVSIEKDTIKTMCLEVFASAYDSIPASQIVSIKIPAPGVAGCPEPYFDQIR